MQFPSKEDFRKEINREESGEFKGPSVCEGIKPLLQLEGQAPEIIVEGLWRREEVLLLGGGSKSWKSFALMDLLYCVANSFEWLAWPKSFGGSVLHIDLELFPSEIRRRFNLIAKAYGQGTIDDIDVLPLRGQSFRLGDFARLGEEIEPGKYRAISLDPIYRMLVGPRMSESDGAIVVDFMNIALEVARRLKCGIVVVQHFSKGNQADKRAIDAYSGSGVWGRAPDACLTLREHEDEKCYSLAADLRHGPPVDPFVVTWEFPRFYVNGDKDPDALKRPKPGLGRPIAFTIEQLCKLIESDEYVSYSHLMRRAEAASVSESTFKRRLKEAKFKGFIALQPTDETYFLTASYVEKFRE